MNLLFPAFILCYVFGVSIQATGNFILTSPKVLDAGTTAYFPLTVFDVSEGGTVTLRLTHKSTNDLIAFTQVEVSHNHNMLVEMNIPPMSSDVSAKLHVVGSFSSGYQIESFKEVQVRRHTILTFIQTDKPLYKPGQTIRFRVLPMDNQLKPLDSSTFGDIWIEDPSNIRVAQWKNVKFTEGIKQFDLPLSDEPPLGTWAIKSVINQVTTTQNFKVQKYELPKFEVTIQRPKIIMAVEQIIPIEICAKYTYGKTVEGNLKARITHKTARKPIHRGLGISFPSVEHQSQLAGCGVFQVNTADLSMHLGRFRSTELEIFAEVTENGTGITRNATKSFKISHQYVILEFLNDDKYYKPKLAYTGILSAKKPDGTPAASEKIEICAEIHQNRKCLIFTADKDGLIHFTVKPSSPFEHIKVEATTVNYEDINYPNTSNLRLMKPEISMTIYPWSSPSGNYLYIQPTTEEFQCDKEQSVRVQYTEKLGSSTKFYHQVLSKGRIVQQGSHQRSVNPKTDELPYDFEDGTLNKNSVTNSTEEPETGEFVLTFDTRATMSPKARLLIFYVREDKEVVADSRMFHIKKCLQNNVSLAFRHEQQHPNTEASMLLSATPESLCGIGMVDKSVRLLEDDKSFNMERVIRSLKFYDSGKKSPKLRWRCYEGENDEVVIKNMPPADAVAVFDDAGMVVISDLKINSVPCEAFTRPPYRRKGYGGRMQDNPRRGMISAAPQKEEIRTYFPETWLWELQTVGSSGETAITRQLPHSITEWVGGAVCVHPKTGLGISDLSSITTFQPFFIDFQLPYSVVRDEKITLVVTVFNYLSECLPIKVSLEPSDDYVLLSSNRYQKVCVCGGKSVSTRFPIRPATIGKVNVTVYAYSIEQDDKVCGNNVTAGLGKRDAVTKELLVEAEGFPKEDIFNYFICPENTNGSFSTEVPLLPPDEVILDSARVYMTVTGDIMGPALSGLKKLVRLPVGCGEQNMVLFAPNIFVMDYLTSTGKITEEIKGECMNNMKTGYQRELQYRHEDGSYSAFGPRDGEGSLWLTAFVLRSFGQARRFINIDEHDLSLSRTWILKRQLKNGCFEPSGAVFHKEMKGGLKSGDESLAPLTSYVLISLLESETERLDTSVVQTALQCLETDSQVDSYALSLFAYASALAKRDEMAAAYLDELEKRSLNKDYVKFWHSSSNSKSVAVEIAGYYILSRLKMESAAALEKVLPVVRWITQQRNSEGGFVSTQDTVVALQALATYGTYMSKKPLDIALAVETDDMTKGFKLDESNKLVTQTFKITDLPTTVDLDAYGDGCAIVQFSLRYNVEKTSNPEGLELNVNSRRRGSSECNLPSLGICMRYAIHKEKTNMAVLSVKLPSGFVADERSLLLLKNEGDVQLMRHEINENEVNLYFQEITNEAKCFEFNIKSAFEVEDAKPSIIRLYDYYQPERQVTKEYSIPTECDAVALPDLQWLPAFNPQTEYDNFNSSDVPGIPTEDSQEMCEMCEIPEQRQIPEPKHEIKDSSPTAELSEVGSVNENFDEMADFNGPQADISENFENDSCPVCGNRIPENFADIYCNSAFALKAKKRYSTSKNVKIIQDVSSYLGRPISVKKFGQLEYDDDCFCPQLQEKGKYLFIVGSPSNLWDTGEKKHKIRLTSSVHVLLVHQRQIHSFLTEALTSCIDDPRQTPKS